MRRWVVYATSLSVNIILNAVFIFGLLGAPALGAAGAAIGTLCARAVEVIIVVYYARKKNDVVRIRIKDMFKRYKWLEKDFFVYAFPVLLNEFAWAQAWLPSRPLWGIWAARLWLLIPWHRCADSCPWSLHSVSPTPLPS